MKKLIILTIILFTIQFLAPVFAQIEQKPELIVQTGHSGEVKSAIFSPDGKLVASNGQGGIIIWDFSTGREIRRIQGIYSATDFSPDSKSIVASQTIDDFLDEENQTPFDIKIFSVSNGKLVKKFPTHKQKINSIEFSPDGKSVLTASDDGTAKLWNITDGSLKKSFIHNKGEVKSATFSSDGNLIATGSAGFEADEQKARIWLVSTGKQIQIINHKVEDNYRKSGVGEVKFSPDDKYLLTASLQSFEDNLIDVGYIKLWDWRIGKEIKSYFGNSPFSLSPDWKLALFDLPNKTDEEDFDKLDGFELIDFENGSIIHRFDNFEFGSKANHLSFSPNGEFILVSMGFRTTDARARPPMGENSLRMYEVSTGKELLNLGDKITPVKQLSISKDENFLLAGDYLWSFEKGNQVSIENFDTNDYGNGGLFMLANWDVSDYEPLRLFSEDGNIAALSFETEEINWGIIFLDVKSGQEISRMYFDEFRVPNVQISPTNHLVLTDDGHSVCVTDIKEKKQLWCEEISVFLPNSEKHMIPGLGFSLFSQDGQILYIRKDDSNLIGVETLTGREVWKTSAEMSSTPGIFLSKNHIIVPTDTDLLSFLDVKTGKEVFNIEAGLRFINTNKQNVMIVYQPSNEQYVLVDKNSGKVISKLPKELSYFSDSFDVYSSRFGLSNSHEKFLATYLDEIRLYDLKTGKILKKFKEHNGNVSRAIFSQNETLVISSSFDGTTIIWDVKSGKEICKLVSFTNGTWIITTPDGKFDTNKIEHSEGLHWIMPDAPLTPLSFEIFMRDYYEPNLLPRLLKCTEDNNCEQEFKPVRNLTELNRTQPKVKIAEIKATDAADVVEVTVEAEDAVSEYQRDARGKSLRSSVEDVRLFRDGQLVGYAPDGDGKAALDKNGRFTKTFTVRLPKNQELKEINFTAYAFNSDRVKSETARQTYVLPKPLPAAKGSAYLVTIGVNASENDGLRLNYAANDARRLQEELNKNLPKEKYEKIAPVSLISDYDNAGKLNENNATKQKIKAVLGKLAGKTVSADLLKDVPNAEFLKKVQPEDLVLIAFSGHGYASREGVFYLVPYDIGASADILKNSVSSDELSLWLRDIDAGEMMMIVDACHSAAAVQGAGFKPGPMGSRGLGQLSYDKGMRILTATQADNVALELGNLQHGLLTYSLVKNGIELGLADYQPKDDIIFSNEWLGFAVKDVPEIYRKMQNGEIKGLLVDGKPKSSIPVAQKRKSNLNLQQPTLFDFSRRNSQFELFDVILR